ncbi:hypothetical protein NBRC116587_25770 [Pseudoteredinibacter isoporae]
MTTAGHRLIGHMALFNKDKPSGQTLTLSIALARWGDRQTTVRPETAVTGSSLK